MSETITYTHYCAWSWVFVQVTQLARAGGASERQMTYIVMRKYVNNDEIFSKYYS
jgi:hypothetical protein